MSRQKLTSWFKIHRAMLKETANLRCASGLQKGTRSKNANCYSHSLHSDLKVFLSRCHCNRTKKKEKRKFAASGLLNYNTAKGLVNLKLSICHLVRLVALFEWLSFFSKNRLIFSCSSVRSAKLQCVCFFQTKVRFWLCHGGQVL